MYKRLISITVAAVCIGIAGTSVALYLYFTQPKTAFVYNNRILTEYLGIKAGRKLYEEKKEKLTGNLDTLEQHLSVMIARYKMDYNKMSEKERALSEEIIHRNQTDYINYKKSVDQQVQEEDNKITAGLLNQVNSYIVEYGKSHGYDYIYGVSDDGSLFYAHERNDITEEVLKGLNEQFEGKKEAK